MSDITDVKRALSLDIETGNKTQSKIKRLKGSKSTYLGHITKTISRINTLMSEPNNVEMATCLQDQLDNVVTNIKSLRYISRVSRFTRRSFCLQSTSFRTERTSCQI